MSSAKFGGKSRPALSEINTMNLSKSVEFPSASALISVSRSSGIRLIRKSRDFGTHLQVLTNFCDGSSGKCFFKASLKAVSSKFCFRLRLEVVKR